MKFSVIIPVYKVEKYLSECVDSLLCQTFKDYEIILVDDGSPDDCPKICDDYAAKQRTVRCLHQANSGQSSARNAGLSVACGEYVLFIDSDDFILSDKFLQTLADVTDTGADVVFYKHCRYLDETKTLCPCAYSYREAQQEPTLAGKLRKMVENDAFFGSAWIKAVKRSVLTENDINFEVGLLGEDMEWNYHLMMNIESVELIDCAFLAYRQREGSISHSLKLKNLTDFIYVLDKWSKPIDALEEQEKRIPLLGSLAKYYSNLLVVYMRVKDSKKTMQKGIIKKMSWLLEYGMSKRPKLISKVYSIFGFDMTILFLNLLDRVKR